MKITLFCHLLKPGDSYVSFGYPIQVAYEMMRTVQNLGHVVQLLDASLPINTVIFRLKVFRPDLIINLGEGLTRSKTRQAIYPELFDSYGFAHTGPSGYVLNVTLDKYLAKMLVNALGLRVPKSVLFYQNKKRARVSRLGNWKPTFPVIVKPNYEGDSEGIFQDSVVVNQRELDKKIKHMLNLFPLGVLVEEFIVGREIHVCNFLGETLDPLEFKFKEKQANPFLVADYYFKNYSVSGGRKRTITSVELEAKEGELLDIKNQATKIFSFFGIDTFGRIDYRLDAKGKLYFLELTPMMCLTPGTDLLLALNYQYGLSYSDFFERLIRDHMRRNGMFYTKNTVFENKVARLFSGYHWHKLFSRLRYGTMHYQAT